MKSKYIPLAFAVFGLMCGIFGFFTEVRNVVVIIPSSFFLESATVSFLAAIFFEMWRKD